MIAQMERGAAMDAALDSSAFKEAIDHLTSYHIAGIVACKPGAKEDRDALNYHHAMQRALSEIVDQMVQWSQSGKAAAEALEWSRAHEDE